MSIGRLERVLRDKKGLSYPLVAAIVLALLILMMIGYEYMRLQIIASGVRDALQSAVITVANENYEHVYDGLITGYTGGYEVDEDNWLPSLSTGDIYGELDSLLGTQPQGSHHIKVAGDAMEFELYGLTVDVVNTPFNPAGNENLEVLTSLTLEVPVWFMGQQVDVMKANLVVASRWMDLF